MTIYSGQTTQLIQGVSQQHPKDRAEGQVGAQENCISDIVAGLRRRPAFKVLSELSGITTDFILDDVTAVYSYSRGDGNEEYIMLFDRWGRVKVYDAFTGAEKAVTNNNQGYLGDTNPAKNLRFHTIGDSTFVLNTSQTISMKVGSASPGVGYMSLVYCVRASYGHRYQILVDNVVKAECVTPVTVPIDAVTQHKQTSLNSHDIIQALFVGSAPTDWTIVSFLFGTGGTLQGVAGWGHDVRNDVMLINNTANFQISVTDGNHGNDLKATRNTVQSFSDLPKYAPMNYRVEVQGVGDEQYDNYWVEWLPETGDPLHWDGTGVWQECIAAGTLQEINEATMPTLITREASGDFENNAAEWVSRAAGDDLTNPVPSFVDTTANDIGSFCNRLFMLTGENIVMTRAFDQTAFFSESVAAPADDDPVDSASSDNQVTDLLHSAIINGSLVLFSNNAQFIHPKDQPVTPGSFSVSSDTKFNVSPDVKPVVTGSSIMFPTDFGAYTNVWEYNLNTLTGAPQCEATTKHVPRYIVGNPVQMIANTTTDYVFLRTDASDTEIYVLQFYSKDNERAQLAWHRWDVPNVDRIISMTLLNQRLFVLVERDTRIYLEFLDLSLPLTDNSDIELFIDHHYSSAVTDGPFTVGGRDYANRLLIEEPDITTFVYGTGATNPGFLIANPVIDGGYLYTNCPSGTYIIQGYKYTSSGELTNPFVKDQNGRPYTDKTIIEFVSYNVQETGYLELAAEHVTGLDYEQVFNGQVINHWQYKIGVASLLDTDIYLPVSDYRELVTLKYSSDHHLGFSLMSLDWSVRMQLRGRRSQ